ncbi:MAG TPA: hypothetical protein VNI01_12080 [Elusimicrobiota bacterium]|jgi:hypothetical protein|nr:hypothetical protein [Elusimicrobiota bacterium]
MNPWLEVGAGCVFFLAGLGYLYQPRLMERLNAFAREFFLNDSYIALHRQKYGTFFLLVALLFIYLGYVGLEKFPR